MSSSATVKTALITGASAGIGKSFATLYAKNGFDLVIVARRKDALQTLADALKKEHGVMVHVIPLDLANPSAPEELTNTLDAKGIDIHTLINNAGYALSHSTLNTELVDVKAFMQVLMSTPVELCHRLAPSMIAAGEGHIINISSIAAFMPPIKGDIYCAAKSFLLNFSLGLAAELKPAGVHCTALCPGFTFSEFHDVMGTRKAVSKLPRFMWMDADEVALQGYQAVSQGKDIHIPGRVNQGASQLVSMLPPQIRQFFAGRQSILEY
ncbi:Putative dehydrogenase [gamma proteobacterium HdN1]|nr:Putative dehydrogenase [gamma proteobacterium HdN1]